MDPDPEGPKTCDPDPDPEHCVVQKILEFCADPDTCVKEGNTFWRTKAALEALVDQYRSSDDEDYRSNPVVRIPDQLKSVIQIGDVLLRIWIRGIRFLLMNKSV